MDVTTWLEGTHRLVSTSAGCVGLLILLTYVINLYLPKSTSPWRRLPPGPTPKPFIGNLFDMPPGGERTSHWIKLGETYGPIMSLRILGQTLIFINKYEIVKELLDRRSSKYSNRSVATFAGELVGYNRSIVYEQPGDKFRQMRKITHSNIGSSHVFKKYDEYVDLETRRYLFRLLESPADFVKHIRKEAGSIILRIVYGYQTEPHRSDDLVELIEQVMLDFSDSAVPGRWVVDVIPILKYLPEWFPGAGFKRTARRYHDNMTKSIDIPYNFVTQQMKDGLAAKSVVSTVLSEEGTSMSEDRVTLLKEISAALYAGGADTTVASMEVFFLAMLKYPHVQRKAQAEIDLVLGSSRLPSVTDRSRLPYCEAVLRETLRWNPIGEQILPHVTSEDDEYNGYFIPKGAIIFANYMGFCHDPADYHDPTDFKPERFLGDNPERDPLEYIWGYGKRICPGRHLAYENLWLEISRTISSFNITPDEGGLPQEQWSTGFVRRPLPFKATIKVRGAEWEKLIREVQMTNPFPEKGDSDALVME